MLTVRLGDFCDGEWDSRVGLTMAKALSFKCSGYLLLKKKHTQRNKKCGIDKQVKRGKMSTFMVKVGLYACSVCSVVYQCFLSKIQILIRSYSSCPLQAFHVWDIS